MSPDEQYCWELQDGKLIAAVDPIQDDGEMDANISAAGYSSEISSGLGGAFSAAEVTLYKNTVPEKGNPLFYIHIMGGSTGIASLIAKDFKQLVETSNYLSGLLALIKLDQSSAISESTIHALAPRP